jgi:hypothetical protein
MFGTQKLRLSLKKKALTEKEPRFRLGRHLLDLHKAALVAPTRRRLVGPAVAPNGVLDLGELETLRQVPA